MILSSWGVKEQDICSGVSHGLQLQVSGLLMLWQVGFLSASLAIMYVPAVFVLTKQGSCHAFACHPICKLVWPGLLLLQTLCLNNPSPNDSTDVSDVVSRVGVH